MRDTGNKVSRKGVESRNASETRGEDVSGRRKLPLKEVIGAQRFEYISANGTALEMEIVGSILPTFLDLVEALENSMPIAPPAFRPISSLCGMRHSPFDSVIPFETLQVRRNSSICTVAAWSPLALVGTLQLLESRELSISSENREAACGHPGNDISGHGEVHRVFLACTV